MIRILTMILFTIFLFTALSGLTHANTIYGVGVKTNSSTWSGKENEKAFSADARVTSININAHKKHFYWGLNFSGGNFYFGDISPNHPNKVTFDHDEPITLSHFDIFSGYDFWQYGSAFIAIKTVNLIWPTDDRVTWSGIGGGVQGFYPISEHWVAYSTLSITPMFVDADDKSPGRGVYVGINLGINYLFWQRYYLHSALTSENLSYTIETETNNFSFGGVLVGFGAKF